MPTAGWLLSGPLLRRLLVSSRQIASDIVTIMWEKMLATSRQQHITIINVYSIIHISICSILLSSVSLGSIASVSNIFNYRESVFRN